MGFMAIDLSQLRGLISASVVSPCSLPAKAIRLPAHCKIPPCSTAQGGGSQVTDLSKNSALESAHFRPGIDFSPCFRRLAGKTERSRARAARLYADRRGFGESGGGGLAPGRVA